MKSNRSKKKKLEIVKCVADKNDIMENQNTESKLEDKPIEYLNEFHRMTTEKALEYIAKMKTENYTLEDVLAQQKRNSTDTDTPMNIIP